MRLRLHINRKKLTLKLKKAREAIKEGYKHWNIVRKPKLLDSYRNKKANFLFKLKKNRMNVIKLLLFTVLVWFLTSSHAPIIQDENGTFSGVIDANMNWSGTIYISGDVLIPPSYTLYISHGTSVLFLPGDNTNQGMEKVPLTNNFTDLTLGRNYEATHSSLSARIVADHVIFTSARGDKSSGDWSGLELFSGSVLNHSVVEYSRNGVIVYPNSIVTNVTSRFALWNCFDVKGGVVKKSRANNCWHHCLLVFGNSTVKNSGGSDCRVAFGIYGNSTLSENFAVNFCANFSGDWKYYQKYKASTLISEQGTQAEGFYESRKVYSCD